jgi:hypothetical protein
MKKNKRLEEKESLRVSKLNLERENENSTDALNFYRYDITDDDDLLNLLIE